MELLKLKLKQDVTSRINDYLNSTDKTVNQEWLTQCIDVLVDHSSFPVKTYDLTLDNTRCKARIWKSRLGIQCTHKHVNGDYCQKHHTMLQTYGVLRFGDMREPRPDCDLIKQNNEKLSWEGADPYDRLNYVLASQAKKVILATPHLIV